MTTAARFFPFRIARALGRSARSRGRSRASVSWTLPGAAERLARRATVTLAACSNVGIFAAGGGGDHGRDHGSKPAEPQGIAPLLTANG